MVFVDSLYEVLPFEQGVWIGRLLSIAVVVSIHEYLINHFPISQTFSDIILVSDKGYYKIQAAGSFRFYAYKAEVRGNTLNNSQFLSAWS